MSSAPSPAQPPLLALIGALLAAGLLLGGCAVIFPDNPFRNADGGGGGMDAGLPRPDAGPRDAGRPDAGRSDAGPPDAGPEDAGPCEVDASRSTDPLNCGVCGRACGPSADCRSGNCGCHANRGDCNGDLGMPGGDGCEIDLFGRAEHCGACNAECGPGGECDRLTCICTNSAYGDCDGDQGTPGSNGCETRLDSNSDHCGMCGNACAAGEYCNAGICTACVGGGQDCNRDSSDRCETSVDYDPDNCGACGSACMGNQFCDAGSCATCAPDARDCNLDGIDGCETDIATDSMNCGSCGYQCGARSSCNGTFFRCRCDAGFGDCNSDLGTPGNDGCEIDMSSDPMNCGTCGTVCMGSCMSGTCV